MGNVIRKVAYIDQVLMKEIKLKIISEDIKISLSELGRRIWEFYLEKEFPLKGYKNMIKDKKRIKAVAVLENRLQILVDEELANRIDIKLVSLEKLYKGKDNQYFSITWITNELLQRVFIDEEFGKIIK
jgi:hypothetical protein